MENCDYIGFIAAMLTTIAFIPQTIKVIQTRDTRALSLSMYILFTLGVFLWLVYGFMKMDYPLIFANLITVTLAFIILVIKIKNKD